MSKQQGFGFIAPESMPSHCPVKAPPIDPNVDPADSVRLKGQNAKILELLQEKAEVSNADLAAVSLKYTSRLSDIREAFRKAGYAAEIKARRGDGGVWWYSLEGEKAR